MDKVRSFRSLVALIFIRWKALLVGALVGAILLGGVQTGLQVKNGAFKKVSEEYLEQKYEQVVRDSEARKRELQTRIEQNREKLSVNQDYVDNSFLMQIDPNNKYIGVLDVSIGFDNAEALAESGSFEYLENSILTQYVLSFEGASLETIESLARIRQDSTSKYWKEVLEIELLDNGILEIRTKAASEEQAKEFAYAVYEYFLTMNPLVASASCEHSLIVISYSAECAVDKALAEHQKNMKVSLSDYRGEIENALVQLEEFRIPDKEEVRAAEKGQAQWSSILLFALLGAIAGIVLTAIWVVLHAIGAGQVITAAEIEDNIGMRYIGSLSERICEKEKSAKAIWDRISKERVWDSKLQALDYIVESLKEVGKDGKVLLTSISGMEEDDKVIAEILNAAEERKIDVEFVKDALRNPKFVEGVQEPCIVVCVEEPVRSDFRSLQSIKNICDEEGKRAGFIFKSR